MPGPAAPPEGDQATPAPIRRAGSCPRSWFVLLVSVLLGLVADLGSKELAFRHVADAPYRPDRELVLRVLRDAPEDIMLLVPPHQAVIVIPSVLEFRLVLNSGAVFGTGQGRRWFFIGFTGAALAFALFLFARWTHARDPWSHAAIGLIISGGLGNLYDRVLFGCVRDFIHPLPGVKLPFGLTWPHGSDELWPYISNVADALLLIGIGVLMIRLWRHERGHGPVRAA